MFVSGTSHAFFSMPRILSAPIINGTPLVGTVSTYTPGSYSGTPTVTVQWMLDGSPIGGATSSTYTPVAGNEGANRLSVRETAIAAGGGGSPSVNTSPVVNVNRIPTFSSAPTIPGTPVVGQSITYNQGLVLAFPGGSITQQWLRDGSAIAGATGPNYTPITGDASHLLSIKETYTNSVGSANSTSTASTVDQIPTFSSPPVINGTPTVGVATTYAQGTVTGVPTPTSTQQWKLNGGNIVGATGATYTPVSGDSGGTLTVQQTATNSVGSTSNTSVGVTVTGSVPNNLVFVRAGATGTNTGADWTNAFTSLPSQLVRGNLYYIAGGTYGAYTFSTLNSGTTPIEIRHATIADHGSNVGWNNAFDTETLFTSSGRPFGLADGCGYLTVNGQYGTGGVPGSFGIRCFCTGPRDDNSGLAMCVGIDQSSGGHHNTTLKFMEIDWNNGNPAGNSGCTRGIMWNGFGNATDNCTFDNLYIHHSSGFGIYKDNNGANYTVKNCFFELNGGGGNAFHYETMWTTGPTSFSFHDNVFKDTLVGGITGWCMIGSVSNGQIYNNLFYCSDANRANSSCGGNGIISTWSGFSNVNVKIIGNTLANTPDWDGNPGEYRVHHFAQGTGSVDIKNNLYYFGPPTAGQLFTTVGGVIDSNLFGGGSIPTGTNTQNIGVDTTIFVNYATRDLRLSRITNSADTTVGAPYNVDHAGNPRPGPDGHWDIGAYEFG